MTIRRSHGFLRTWSFVAALALSAVCSRAIAEPPGWKVGLASVKITPEEPVRMSGYASRTEPSRGVAHDLFAKAIALEDQEGHQAVLITSDVIGFAASFAEPTCRQIIEQTGLERKQILLNSSHTHTGPRISLDESELDYSGQQAEATVRYSHELQRKIVDLAVRSLQQMEPANLSWGVGVATFVMNRREFTERGVQLGVNPRGLVDRSVPVLRIDNPDGTLRAVLFGAACHNTTLGGEHLDISGDFAGYAQAHVERSRDGVQAMFMQGCAGDANPFPRGSEEIARLHGTSLGAEVLRVLDTELQPVNGPLHTELTVVDLPLARALSPVEIARLARSGSWQRFVADKMREVIDRGQPLPMTYHTSIAFWQLGQDLSLVALPGEVVVDYVAMIEKSLGPRKLWIAAYCNDVFGYLPSARVLEEGGYETRGLYYGGIGFFSPQAQDVLVQTVNDVARKAGRPIEP